MMDKVIAVFFSLYGLFALVTIGIVVYLVVKRIKEKGNEEFESRDN